MGSARSSFNITLLGKNLARFWPIWGLYALIWTVLLPVGILLRRDIWANSAREFPLTLLDGGSNMALVLALLFGILCAMAVFSYLCSARSVGMFHALPMRREGLFLTNYLSGLTFLWGPNFGVFLLALAAEALNGKVVFSSLFTWLVVTCLLCLFFYSFAVFCAMFTGHILALPAFYGILNILAAALTYLVENIAREFLFGFTGAAWAEDWALWFTPALKLLYGTGLDYASARAVRYYGLGLVTLYALIGVMLTGAALILYRRRHLERAGDIITVGWVRPVFRYGVALCFAVALGAFFYSIFYTILPRGAWTLLGWMLLWGAAGCFIAEMLLRKRLWVFRSSWKGCALFLACIAAVMAGLELDVIGFEGRVPDTALVRSVRITGVNSMPYDSGSYLDVTLSQPDGIKAAADLHTAIVREKARLEDFSSSSSSTESWAIGADGQDYQTGTTASVTLRYQLVDGTDLERQYTLPILAEALEDPHTPAGLLDRLINLPETVRQTNPILFSPDARLVDAALVNLYDPEQSTYGFEYLPAGLLPDLLAALQADLESGDLGRRYLLDDQARRDNCCYADLELTFRLPQSGTSGGSAPRAESDTEMITITLQKSARRTMEVLHDYPDAFLSQAEVYRHAGG